MSFVLSVRRESAGSDGCRAACEINISFQYSVQYVLILYSFMRASGMLDCRCRGMDRQV